MANTNYGINVNVNFNGVSYNATTKTWSGTPTWTITPPSQGIPPVKAGTNTSTITWSLHAAAQPQGFTASFAAPGVVMATGWTGGTPANTNSTTCVASDNFNGLTANQVFEYVVTVTLANADGTVSQNWDSDPDVINEAGTANVCVLVHLRK